MGSSMSSKSIVILKEDCSIKNARRIVVTIREVFDRGEHAAVDCSGVEQADISFIQLLVASQKTFHSRGLRFEIVNPADPLLAAMARAGFQLDLAAGHIC